MHMTSNAEEHVERQATYIGLVGLFLSLCAAFLLRERHEGEELDVQPLDVALLGIATFRLGRPAAYDKATESALAPFTATERDESGAGQTVVAKGCRREGDRIATRPRRFAALPDLHRHVDCSGRALRIGQGALANPRVPDDHERYGSPRDRRCGDRGTELPGRARRLQARYEQVELS